LYSATNQRKEKVMMRLDSKINGSFKVFSRGVIIIVAALLLSPVGALCSPKKLVDDNDYSDKDFRKCNITDYSNMVDGDDVKWVWIDPSEKLSHYKLVLGKMDNKSDIHSKSMVTSVKNNFRDAFSDRESKGNKGTLTADVCIYEAENFSGGKAWIPFVGGHEMQAGIGVEMVLRDSRNRIVGKFRHSAREGAQIEAAAQEVVGDLLKYIDSH
jgi:hypothetical protein